MIRWKMSLGSILAAPDQNLLGITGGSDTTENFMCSLKGGTIIGIGFVLEEVVVHIER
jgi:hypothetical protein